MADPNALTQAPARRATREQLGSPEVELAFGPGSDLSGDRLEMRCAQHYLSRGAGAAKGDRHHVRTMQGTS